jgi:TolB-like protein/Tfp pilus assembly protein PilF
MAEERVQRRLAAILAADVVGYSRLMGADEAGTRAQFNAHLNELIEPVIANRSGRIVKTLGDGLLVEFASVVDAVQSAVEIQKGMVERNTDDPDDRRIEFRIGVNLGDVIVEGGDIHGDGVNVAARLESISEPGGICISGKVYEEVRDRIDIALDDLGEREFKNINRPVRVWRWSGGDAPASAMSWPKLELPDKPSIAVLPFENMSGDPEQEYFSDGITEDIITELARFHNLFVIARNSSFAFRGKHVDVMEVGQKLGVRYVVEGSVRKVGKRVRVTAQLIDAATGHHLWAERYDRDLEDIFAVQDEVTRTIVSILPGRLEDAGLEHAERKQTSNMSAYDFFLLGNARWKELTPEGFAEARAHFENALALDPLYARAHANIAWTHVCDVFFEFSDPTSLDAALPHMQTAISIDDGDAWAHGVFAQLLFLLKKDDEAEIHFNRALGLNPNDADVVAVFANILVYWGRCEEALRWIETAKRLNPFPPPIYHWYHALALYSAREYGDAVKVLKEIQQLDRWGHGMLAACYAQIGSIDDARQEAQIFVEQRRDELQMRGLPLPMNALDLAKERASRYRVAEDREHFLGGLRKAGASELGPDADNSLTLSDKPSVAVLPFENMSGDQEQEYFSDGVSEDLITALSRIHWFFVTARNSSFSYKGKSPDVRQVAEELGVRYVLEGSVRKAANRVRITAQLIDGTSGNHVWAERYDREIVDVFDLQDEMTEKIIAAIEPAISKAEIQRSRAKRPDSLDTWDLCQRGWWHRYRNRREDYVEAIGYFERALEKDPQFVSALSGLADALSYQVVFSFVDEPTTQVERAISYARRAVEIDEDDPIAHLSLGRAYFAGNKFEDGIHSIKSCLRLNPYSAAAIYSLGTAYIAMGQYDMGITEMRRFMTLSPQDVMMGPAYARLAQAYLGMKNYEQAAENAEEAFRQTVRPHWPGKSFLVSALGHLGRKDEARHAIVDLEELMPGITVGWIAAQPMPISMANDYMPDYLDGLRKAGLPE